MDDAIHLHWMRQALLEADAAAQQQEVPVGSVVVYENQIIARGHNQRESWQDPTGHAELIAMRRAAHAIGSWRLEDCTLYITLEPCPMCAGAIVLARIPLVVFGAYDPKAGACGSVMDLTNDSRLNHRAQTRGGILRDECAHRLTSFFAQQRKLGKK